MNKHQTYQKILEKRFKECDVEIKEILNKIEVTLDENTGVFFYTLHFEGLGTQNSDIDIYVITSHKLKRDLPGTYLNCNGVVTWKIKDLELDIEYWDITEIEKIMQKCKKNSFIENDLLKILLRLNYGYAVYDNVMTKKF